MSGILNSKSRILDVILTQIGREQMSRGDFEISFATFSDRNVQYKEGLLPDNWIKWNETPGVLSGVQEDIFFEAFSSPNDEIIPEISDEGNFLLLQSVSPTLKVVQGVLYEETANGYQKVDAFENIDKFSNITTNRWNNLQLLKTKTRLQPPIFSHNTDQEPIIFKVQEKTLVETASLPPVIVDERFSNSLNTMFLAPVVSTPQGETKLRAFNNYTKEYSKDSVLEEIQRKSSAMQSVKIKSETKNGYEFYNFLGQAFIGTNQDVKKYLVVDGGEFVDSDGVPVMQVYHLGFIFKDSSVGSGTSISKFSRGFSIVFHNDEGGI